MNALTLWGKFTLMSHFFHKRGKGGFLFDAVLDKFFKMSSFQRHVLILHIFNVANVDL